MYRVVSIRVFVEIFEICVIKKYITISWGKYITVFLSDLSGSLKIFKAVFARCRGLVLQDLILRWIILIYFRHIDESYGVQRRVCYEIYAFINAKPKYE